MFSEGLFDVLDEQPVNKTFSPLNGKKIKLEGIPQKRFLPCITE